MDKVKIKKQNNQKLLFFLIGLSLIGVIFGSLFIIFISKSDQSIVINYITNFMNSFSEKINYIDVFKINLYRNNFTNILIWLLGISVIGIPIIIFLLFYKFFILGFQISAFILTYKLKGLLISILYFFPLEMFDYIILTLISFFSFKMSFNIIYSIFKKKNLNLKKFINKYIYLLVFCIVGELICSLYETFIIPVIFNYLSFLIK